MTHDMKTVTHMPRGAKSRQLLHIEFEGGIVNIQPGLSDANGNKVTRVDVRCDNYSGEAWHMPDLPADPNKPGAPRQYIGLRLMPYLPPPPFKPLDTLSERQRAALDLLAIRDRHWSVLDRVTGISSEEYAALLAGGYLVETEMNRIGSDIRITEAGRRAIAPAIRFRASINYDDDDREDTETSFDSNAIPAEFARCAPIILDDDFSRIILDSPGKTLVIEKEE